MSGKITLITGGARSGKSCYAESLAKTSTQPVAYLATAISFDAEMQDRIKKHQESRPKEWTTIEGYKDLYKYMEDIGKEHGTILLDCLTIMITNLMLEEKDICWDTISSSQVNKIEGEIQKQCRQLLKCVREQNLWLIAVTNELGMGIVPENKLARIFRDIVGRINQIVAKEADEVIFTVSGIPMKIK